MESRHAWNRTVRLVLGLGWKFSEYLAPEQLLPRFCRFDSIRNHHFSAHLARRNVESI